MYGEATLVCIEFGRKGPEISLWGLVSFTAKYNFRALSLEKAVKGVANLSRLQTGSWMLDYSCTGFRHRLTAIRFVCLETSFEQTFPS